ncbi:MAG: hypothetical protein O2955_10740 [Planctomycetota bacterium]|nr:hypothetical protein [Planctomycetota bacterium]MDA1212988.1 hypothetical protein [Planctomycetota bacterium]
MNRTFTSDARLPFRFVAVWLLPLLASSASSMGQEIQDSIEGEPADHMHQIFVADSDGSKMRILATIPDYLFQGSSEWSRDGKRIAFDTWRGKDGEEGVRFGKIAIVNSDGTEPRIIADGVMPSLSPRGNRVAYSRAGKGVMVQTIVPENQPPVSLDERGWGTAWSPDGTRIAYAHFSPPNLVIHDVIEETRQFLFPEEDGPYRQIQWNFAWSPDSSQIAFKGIRADGTSTLSIVDARGAEFGHTTRYIGEILPTIAWSPDGKQILFSKNSLDRDNPRQIFFVDPNTPDPPRILPLQPANRWIEDMSFSPDGTRLTFSASRPVAKK